MRGNIAVTAIGTASVIHQIIIQAAKAKTLPALGEMKEVSIEKSKIKCKWARYKTNLLCYATFFLHHE